MASFQDAPGKRRHGHKRRPSAAEEFDWEPRRAESRHSLPYRTRQPDISKADRRRSKHPIHASRTQEDLDIHSMPPPVRLLTRSATTHSRGRLRYVDDDEDDYEDDIDDDEDETEDEELERERLRGRLRSTSRGASRSKSRGASRPQSSRVVSRAEPPVKSKAQSGAKSRARSKVKSRNNSRVRSRPASRSSHSTESITIPTPTRSSYMHMRSPPSDASFRGSSDESNGDSDGSSDYIHDRRLKTRTLKERMNGTPDSEPAANLNNRSRPTTPEKFVPEIESPSEDSDDQVIAHRPRIIVKRTSSRHRHRQQSRSPSRGPRHRKHGDARASSSPKRHPQKYYHSDFTASEKRSFSRSRATSASRMPSPYSVESSPKQAPAYPGNFYPAPAPPQVHERDTKAHICFECAEPFTRLAKLKCGHRWCDGCLKKRFRSSVKEARSMPPKCCTADMIPLKHVNELFDVEFKKTWNRKYREAAMRNCHYCPKAKCQERIRPEDICHHSNGRTSATCRKCDTELCGVCFNKWHESKHCPTDINTAHWKQCFNCQEMVELKEGANRLACPGCGARYCLICEAKMKSCKCPAFRYDADDEDEVDQVIPVAVVSRERLGGFEGPRPPHAGWQGHREFREDEPPRRRQPPHADAHPDDDDDDFIDDLNPNIGMGNPAAHLMNEDFRRAQGAAVPQPPPAVPLPPPSVVPDRITSGTTYVSGVNKARGVRSSSMERRLADRFSEQRQGPSLQHRPFSQHYSSLPIPPMGMGPHTSSQPPMIPNPISRRHTMDNDLYEMQFERPYATAPVPRRVPTREYMDDFDIHPSMGRRRVRHMAAPPPSALAGLTGAGNGMNRVNEWMDHVDPYPTDHQTVA